MVALLIALLYLAKGVLAPVALAVPLCFLLIPVCDFIERLGERRVPVVMVTVTLAFALLGDCG